MKLLTTNWHADEKKQAITCEFITGGKTLKATIPLIDIIGIAPMGAAPFTKVVDIVSKTILMAVEKREDYTYDRFDFK
ncbi:MAG: hypothetical protein KGJ89_05175 [Patescibacteria group bacterium]|nr:hypothetical protein [Patescibacteria group bacterium]MDE2227314.1 hypothetical protein [Patescibacteria group bacterium]